MIATISPAMLADLRRKGEKITLIDVRTPAEFGESGGRDRGDHGGMLLRCGNRDQGREPLALGGTARLPAGESSNRDSMQARMLARCGSATA